MRLVENARATNPHRSSLISDFVSKIDVPSNDIAFAQSIKNDLIKDKSLNAQISIYALSLVLVESSLSKSLLFPGGDSGPFLISRPKSI